MKKVFLKKIGYVSICCFVHERQGIFAVFFRCLVQGGNRGFLQYSWKGLETNRGLRGCFLLPGGFLQCSLDALYRGAIEDFCSVFTYSWEGSARVIFAAWWWQRCVSKSSVLFMAFFAVFFGCPVQEHLCILQGSFDLPWNDSGKIVVFAGVFLQCSLDALCRGATRHFCRGL